MLLCFLKKIRETHLCQIRLAQPFQTRYSTNSVLKKAPSEHSIDSSKCLYNIVGVTKTHWYWLQRQNFTTILGSILYPPAYVWPPAINFARSCRLLTICSLLFILESNKFSTAVSGWSCGNNKSGCNKLTSGCENKSSHSLNSITCEM